MTLVSEAARNASLSMSYGDDKGSLAPVNLLFKLYAGDPTNGGIQVTDDGNPVEIAADNDGVTWPTPPADGYLYSVELEYVSVDGFSDIADFGEICDADTGDVWDSGPLDDEIDVGSGGTVVRIQATVYYRPPEV